MRALCGDFGNFGAVVKDGRVTITYATETSQPTSVVLFDLSDGHECDRVEIEKDWKQGRVCSVTLEGLDLSNTGYLLEMDGDLVLDPYARKVRGRDIWNDSDRKKHAYQVFGGFSDEEYVWKHPVMTKLKPEDLIIYKLHMRGFSMQHGVNKEFKGNVKGFLKKLGEVADMGFTALEFMPIYDFEEIQFVKTLGIDADGMSVISKTTTGRVNYWGYGDAAYFAPKASYFQGQDCVLECKKMVDAVHGKGMEVYMEISNGPGADEDLILEAMRYWVQEYHIDGFHLIGVGFPLRRIAKDPYLADTRIFYDNFPQDLLEKERGSKHLFVYNDDFMYALRKLQNHMDGNMPELANQMKRQNSHFGFVNYAANNTGFTLYDAYCYGEKHNEDNGEENRDGNNFNYSNNYGVEGKTSSKAVQSIRLMHVHTAIAAVMLSQGIPMLYAGDEVLNSQEGNNNAYCQDNPVGWVQFFNGKQQKELREFVKRMIQLRKQNPVLRLADPYQMSDYKHLGMPDLSYHGREPWIISVGQEKKALGLSYHGAYADKDVDLMLCYNFHYDWEDFALPTLADDRQWYFFGNTAEYESHAEEDSVEAKSGFVKPQLLDEQTTIIVPGGSLSVLLAMSEDDAKSLN